MTDNDDEAPLDRSEVTGHARRIVDADPPTPSGSRDDWPNPMLGFLAVLHPWRRWVLLVAACLAVGLAVWRMATG